MLIADRPHSYDALYAQFRWAIPARFNIGVVCSDMIAAKTPDALAILNVEGDVSTPYSFSQLAKLSNRFANVLAGMGIARGDRVAIMAPQSIQTAAAHLAIYKCGAIAVPMAVQFGHEAIAYRLKISGAKAFVIHDAAKAWVDRALQDLEHTPQLIVTDTKDTNSFWGLCETAKDTFNAVETAPDDPAMMLFTSGTTGKPKAALHGHRVLAGHMPGIQMSQDFMPQASDRLWTPSDWAWAGGLLNALLPALALGIGVVAARVQKFDPFWAANHIKTHTIRNVFMPATALRLMLAADIKAKDGLDQLRAMGSAGEALGGQTLQAARDQWGLTINEFYGQTEANTVLGASHALGIIRDGSMGKPTPGHRVAILDDKNQPLPAGQAGQLAIARDDPVMFLQYWNNPEATKAKFAGNWMLTGDQALMDDDGFYHFVGRNDDLITSSGYRIGPTEIEDVLTSHPAVRLAAIVGQPDPVRTEIVTAYVVADDKTDAVRQELKNLVRQRLSAHQIPRDIHFVDDIPMTESGKIIRRHFRKP